MATSRAPDPLVNAQKTQVWLEFARNLAHSPAPVQARSRARGGAAQALLDLSGEIVAHFAVSSQNLFAIALHH